MNRLFLSFLLCGAAIAQDFGTRPIVPFGTANVSSFMETGLTNTTAAGFRAFLDIGDIVYTNLSAGFPLFDHSEGTNVYFNGIAAGTGITVTSNANTFTISSTTSSSALLNNQDTTSILTGNGTYQTVYTYSVPTIPAGKGIRVHFIFQNTTATTANKTIRFSFGGQTQEYGALASGTTANTGECVVTIMNNAGVQNAQRWYASPLFWGNGAYAAGWYKTTAIDTSVAQTLSVLWNAANTEATKGCMFYVEILQ